MVKQHLLMLSASQGFNKMGITISQASRLELIRTD